MDSWYDYPQYFDMVFEDETPIEVDFFEKVFDTVATGTVKRVLEPGCGSGRLVSAMAAKGYHSTGIDLSVPSIRYLKQRLRRRKLQDNAACVVGDMTDISASLETFAAGESSSDRAALTAPFDAVFCTFNTFRHLTSEKDAVAHLNSVADNLRPGGVYILGYHHLPMDAEEASIERWRAKRGGTSICVTFRVLTLDRKTRIEHIRVSTLAKQRTGKVVRIRSEFPLRLYTYHQTRSLFKKVPRLELCGIYDFHYDLEEPRKLDNDLEDALFVFRKRPE